VAGTVAGAWATAAVAVATSPSRLRWRVDRAVLRKYLSFSWPLFAAGLSGLAVTQAAIFAGDATLGLTGVAALTLALAVWRWSMRIDEAVTQALYPVVARMRHRGDLVTESFRTSNRLTLLVAAPIGAAFACFAPDLVAFGLGDEWSSATVLLQLTGVAAVLNQVAFSWSAYFRSASRTRPLAVGAAINTVAFLVLPIPLLLAAGLVGYGWGILGVTALNVLVRRRALQGLIGPLGLPGLAARAMAPAAVAVCVTLALRAVASGERTPGVAVVELVVFTVVSAAACVALERSLLRETLGYLRVRAAVQT
jgi:O-antigen/teichoic acid export membrane protein